MKTSFLARFAILAAAVSLKLALPGALPRPNLATFDKGAKFIVTGYEAGKPALSGFPVLVRIADGSPSGFHYTDMQSADAADKNDIDIAFIDMQGTGLPFEIDTWNPDGTSLVWVRLPSMQNGTEFVMCWGSKRSGKFVCGDNPFSDYVGVWHMSEASGAVADSSGHGLGATPTGATDVSIAVSGKIGSARQNATADSGRVYLQVPDYNSRNVGSAFLVSGWYNSKGVPSGDMRLFSRKFAFDENGGWEVLVKESGKSPKVRGGTNAKQVEGTFNPVLKDNGWQFVSVAFNGTTATTYQNGSLVKSGTIVAATDNGKTLGIGSYGGGNNTTSFFIGDMDEVRLRAGVQSNVGDWIAADYANAANADFLTAGASEEYEKNDNPSAGITVSDIAYTNATITAAVVDLGGSATSVDVAVEVSTDSAFESAVLVSRYSVSGQDTRAFADLLFAPDTQYFVRLTAENPLGGAVTNSVSFTTLAPGAPAGTAMLKDRGFSTMVADVAVTDFGTGGEGATMRLEASTDGFETVAASSEDVYATIGETTALTLPGLAADTGYSLRARIANNWGVATLIDLGSCYTRAVPFATTGIGWTFSEDGTSIDISFGVSGIYDGAEGTAKLTYDGKTLSEKSITSTGTFLWPGIAAAGGTATATVVLSATLDGTTYTQTFTAPIAAGSTSVSVSDIADHASAATAIRVKPGDVVTLPELSGTAHYIVGNKLFGSLEGNVLTALRPGILGIHCVGNDSTTNTLAVLVLPEKIGNGDIYIFKDERIKDNWGYWNEAANWEKLGSETNDSWPHNPNDIAIVAYYANTGVQFDARNETVELAELYAGGYRDDKASITLRCVSKDKAGNPLKNMYSFRRTDGKPALVQLCSNSTYLGNNAYRVSLSFANSVIGLEFLSDTVLSGGWDGTSPNFPQGRFDFSAPTNRIADGVTVTLRDMDTQGQSMGSTITISKLSGGGTFWNHSSATMRVNGCHPDFTGLIRDSGGHGAGSDDRTGPTYFRSGSLTNCTGEVVGWVARSGSDPNGDFRNGVGCFHTGWAHFYNVPAPHIPWFPCKGFAMHGGLLRIFSDNTSAWTNPVPERTTPITADKRLTDKLTIGGGFNYIYGANNNADWTISWFEADSVSHEGTATLRIRDQSLFESSATNIAVYLHGIAQYAVGKGEDPKTSNAASIVPWIVAQAGSKQDEDLRFAAFDENDRLSKVLHSKTENVPLSNFGPQDNAYIWKGGISLSADATVNSLSIVNEEKEKQLGEGRTLTLTSGGLILGDISWLSGSSAIGTEDGGAANGSLVLGDATHPAYVWARGADAVSGKTGPNEIWASVTAPGGFVAAHTGALILGGDQTGICGEIAVNAGTLQLGTAGTPCRLAKELPIRVFANAALVLPNEESVRDGILKFDGAAGWFGKVSVPDGVEATCRKVYWRDYPESGEWQALERGLYTGDEATALATGATYDPLHFEGAGTIRVRSDDKPDGLFIFLK